MFPWLFMEYSCTIPCFWSYWGVMMDFQQIDYFYIPFFNPKFSLLLFCISLVDYRNGTDDSSWLCRSKWKSIAFVWVWTGNKLYVFQSFSNMGNKGYNEVPSHCNGPVLSMADGGKLKFHLIKLPQTSIVPPWCAILHKLPMAVGQISATPFHHGCYIFLQLLSYFLPCFVSLFHLINFAASGFGAWPHIGRH